MGLQIEQTLQQLGQMGYFDGKEYNYVLPVSFTPGATAGAILGGAIGAAVAASQRQCFVMNVTEAGIKMVEVDKSTYGYYGATPYFTPWEQINKVNAGKCDFGVNRYIRLEYVDGKRAKYMYPKKMKGYPTLAEVSDGFMEMIKQRFGK